MLSLPISPCSVDICHGVAVSAPLLVFEHYMVDRRTGKNECGLLSHQPGNCRDSSDNVSAGYIYPELIPCLHQSQRKQLWKRMPGASDLTQEALFYGK
jgi:hypothetical protein